MGTPRRLSAGTSRPAGTSALAPSIPGLEAVPFTVHVHTITQVSLRTSHVKCSRTVPRCTQPSSASFNLSASSPVPPEGDGVGLNGPSRHVGSSASVSIVVNAERLKKWTALMPVSRPRGPVSPSVEPERHII